MSYCGPEGVSDFNFTLALDYRHAIAASALARRPAAALKTLLLWGSIRDGELRLEPVFEWAAPVKLPESPGPYRLAGADGTGQRLFELSFSPDETGDGDMGFLFAIETGCVPTGAGVPCRRGHTPQPAAGQLGPRAGR